MRILISLFLLTLLLPFSSYAEEMKKTFGAESFTLDNGMQVIVIPNHRAPVVTHMVWYRVGSADEPAGQSGIAHFLEHLMFKGTENIPPGDFSRRVKAMGGNDNAFTSYDYTAYHQSVAVEHLETIMEMEADRMRGLLFPPNEVASERAVVIEERRQRIENDPTGYFSEYLSAMLFVNHPYGTPVIGWQHEIADLDRQEAIRFYNTWYTPNNAILVVSGDITAKELRPMAEAIYGTIPPRGLPQRDWREVPPLEGAPQLVLRSPEIHQPQFIRIYRVPGSRQNKYESLALEVLQSIMSDSASTRLYRTLVVEQKKATNVYLSYNGSAWSDGRVWISATPADGVTLEELEKAINEQLRILIEDGVTEDELREAKQRLQDQAVYARDSLQGPAMIFGRMLITGSDIEDIEYWPYRIDTVTAEAVQNVAARYLDPEKTKRRPYVDGYVLPAGKDAAATADKPADMSEE